MDDYLNERAAELCLSLESQSQLLQIGGQELEEGPILVDFGVAAPGGIEAGRALAQICLADLAVVDFAPSPFADIPGLAVRVHLDHPALACMGSQYAGWRIQVGDFFAMGSGPMRAAHYREPLVQAVTERESNPDHVVGVLETSAPPTLDVCEHIAEACDVPVDRIILCYARTGSVAGCVQVVARSVETALHKLHELKFDLRRVLSGAGIAPLPPGTPDDLAAIGRTNDAVLYGGDVTLWIDAEDEEAADLAEQLPSRSSGDYGAPFAEIFKRYDGDFYKIDPALFSPARVLLINVRTGRCFRGGELRPDLLLSSWFGD